MRLIRFQLLLAVCSLAIVGLLISCGGSGTSSSGFLSTLPNSSSSSGGGNSSSGGGTFPASMLGTVEGFVFRIDGKIVVRTAPGTGTAVAGATVSAPSLAVDLNPTTVDGSSPGQATQPTISTVTDSKGHFKLVGVVAGDLTITITSNGVTVSIPITVFPQITTNVGEPPVSRQQASTLATQSLGSADPTIVPDALDTLIMGTLSPLPAGTQLAPSGVDLSTNPSAAVTLSSPQWLFYVDGQSFMAFDHKVLYILVDANNGHITTLQEVSPPLINGLVYYGSNDNNVQGLALVHLPDLSNEVVLTQNSGQVAQPAAASSKRVGTSPELSQQSQNGVACPKTYALFVSGGGGSDELANISNVQGIIGTHGIPPLGDQKVYISTNVNSQNPTADVQALFQQLVAEAQPQDLILVDLNGHGTNGGVDLETSFIKHTTLKNGQTVSIPVTKVSMSLSSLNFSNCQADQVAIILEFCHAGSQTKDGTSASVPGLSTPQRRAFVACAAEAAPSNLDGNSVATESWRAARNRLVFGSGILGNLLLDQEAFQAGGAYTNYFIDNLNSGNDTSDYFTTMLSAANNAVSSMANAKLIFDASFKARKANSNVFVLNGTGPPQLGSLKPASGQVDIGATLTLTPVDKKGDSTTIQPDQVSWTSSDNTIATVSSSGVVTGVATGNVVITASQCFSMQTATAFITVGCTPIGANAPLAGTWSGSYSGSVDETATLGCTLSISGSLQWVITPGCNTSISVAETATGKTWDGNCQNVQDAPASGTVTGTSTDGVHITLSGTSWTNNENITATAVTGNTITATVTAAASDGGPENFTYTLTRQ